MLNINSPAEIITEPVMSRPCTKGDHVMCTGAMLAPEPPARVIDCACDCHR